MNATSLEELRAGLAAKREGADDRMEQIRELLVGDHIRSQDARLQALEHRVRELEGLVFRRVDALSQRLEALSGEASSERRAQFDELARMVVDLGDSIRNISRGS
ncbi:MAG: hypothetical protein NW216_02425 [Hyphomicrobium sp.]|nr:hypothetical protein [Hyphomicrobium sp.]